MSHHMNCKIIQAIAFIAAATFLATCGGYSAHQYPPLTASDVMTKISTDKTYKAADYISFANAVMLYPARANVSYHSIPVGDYLLSRVISALPQDAEFTKIRLDEYKSKCEFRGFLSHVWCTTSARLTVASRGKDSTFDVADDVDVGPGIVAGDIAPPFTWGGFNDEAIHAMARMTVDSISKKFHDLMSSPPSVVSRPDRERNVR
jgi:hypothetical protein